MFVAKNALYSQKFTAYFVIQWYTLAQYRNRRCNMYRVAMEKLLKWKESKYRKPLIIEGARQVGKTWLMKEFGRLYYTHTIYVNFDANAQMAALFASDLNVDRLLMGLELYSGQKIDAAHTLLIFDEVQEVPRALSSLKYFCENAPQYHIVCAGSLLGIALHEGTSFPVGKVDFLKLYPLSFPEFLLAIGKERFAKLLQQQDYPMITSFKQTYMDALKQYYFVGACRKQYRVLQKARTIRSSAKYSVESWALMSRTFQSMLQMKSFQRSVCSGTAFLLSWQRKTRSSSMGLFEKAHGRKNSASMAFRLRAGS